MKNTQTNNLSVIVIGGGSTGAAVAHDLALRGFEVTVVERGEIASGTTGRNHCLLHSGARYCVKDQESAISCIEENMILRKIMPHSLELNGGFFVALNDSDMEYMKLFIEGCEVCGIPYKPLTSDEAIKMEPYLSPETKGAVMVPDGCFEPMRFCYSFLASAKKNGSKVLPFTEVIELLKEGNQVTGVKVWDRVKLTEYDIHADMIVNAAGPWATKITEMAGFSIPVIPTPGVMVSMTGRYAQRVMNRMNKSSDGDIIVMQRETSVIGTSSWRVEDADYIDIPEEHIQTMYERGSAMLPILAEVEPRGIFVVARPLLGKKEASEGGREIARSYVVFDHTEDGVEGIVSIAGGKTTDSRGMAESTVDKVCKKFGLEIPCATADTVLESYREFYRL